MSRDAGRIRKTSDAPACWGCKRLQSAAPLSISAGLAIAFCFRMRMALRPFLPSLRAVLAIVAIGSSAIACSGDSPTEGTWPIAGRWSGTAVFGTVRFSATFTQNGEIVGGSGTFTSPLGSGPFTVAGQVVA